MTIVAPALPLLSLLLSDDERVRGRVVVRVYLISLVATHTQQNTVRIKGPVRNMVKI